MSLVVLFIAAAIMALLVAVLLTLSVAVGEFDVWGRSRPEGSVRGASLGSDALGRLRRNKPAMIGFFVAGFMMLFCFLQPWFAEQRNIEWMKTVKEARARKVQLDITQKPDPGPWLRYYRDQIREHVSYPPSWSSSLTPREKIEQWQPGRIRQMLAEKKAKAEKSAGGKEAAVSKDIGERYYLLGTDDKGRDLFSRVVFGGRISFLVAIVATLVTVLIGVSYGAFAGYLGGMTDQVMMRAVDFLYCVPFLFLVIVLMMIANDFKIESENRIILIFMALGAVQWLTLARITRGQVLTLKNSDFEVAARAVGSTVPRVVFRHLVPNVLGPVLAYATIEIPVVMLLEAFLSYLGLGIDEPQTSWGRLAEQGAKALSAVPGESQWWLIVFPAGAMAITLLALNFLGDGLRDALDPRARKAS